MVGSALGIGIACAALPPLIYFGNPAFALLVGGAIVLVIDRGLFPQASALSRYCLQTAIVLLGFRLSLDTLWSLSADYTWTVAAYVLATLGLGMLIGRALRVEAASSKLITAGTAICGGTAIATLSTLVRAQPQQTAVALAIVFLLNVVALFTFPTIGQWLDLSQLEFGLWSALAIHDTSSVVATAAIYGDEAAEVATTIKLGRTLWIIPVALGASLMQTGETAGSGPQGGGRFEQSAAGGRAISGRHRAHPGHRAPDQGTGPVAGAGIVGVGCARLAAGHSSIHLTGSSRPRWRRRPSL
jgi:uncharacterized membrane protein YadS